MGARGARWANDMLAPKKEGIVPAGTLSAMTAICRRVRPRQGSLMVQASFLLSLLMNDFKRTLLIGWMMLLAILGNLIPLQLCLGAILRQKQHLPQLKH